MIPQYSVSTFIVFPLLLLFSLLSSAMYIISITNKHLHVLFWTFNLILKQFIGLRFDTLWMQFLLLDPLIEWKSVSCEFWIIITYQQNPRFLSNSNLQFFYSTRIQNTFLEINNITTCLRWKLFLKCHFLINNMFSTWF